MKDVFYHILEASLYGSVVILAVMALRLLLKRAPRRMICLLWLLAGLRLLLPFSIESSISLQPRIEPVQLSRPVTVPVPDIVAQFAPPAQVPEEVRQEFGGDWKSESFLYVVEDSTIRSLDAGDIAASIWIMGSVVMLGISLISYLRLKWKVREACRRADGCRECAGIETAFVLGFFPPKIYLPVRLSGEVREFIVSHERTHIARGDHWIKLLGYCTLAIHWFNPLVWLGYHLLCRDMEMACDEQVVRSMDLNQRKAYSSALLSCVGKHRAITACPVAFGETSVKQRIVSVLKYKKPGFWITVLAVAALVFVLVCLMTSPGAEEPDLSFLNYENAISLAAEQEEVMFIYCVDSSICPGNVSGPELAAYLDNTDWHRRWWEPGDTSSPGSIEFVIGDDYRITVYDRNFARVQYGEDMRYYRIGSGDYEEALELLQSTELPSEPAESEPAEPPTDEELLARCEAVVKSYQSLTTFQTTSEHEFYDGGVLASAVTVDLWKAGDDFLRMAQTHQNGMTTYYLYENGRQYKLIQDDSPGLASQWSEMGAWDPNGALPWLWLFDWDKFEMERTAWAMEDGVETVQWCFAGPFDVYGIRAYGGILTFRFDGAGNCLSVELMASHREGIMDDITNGEETAIAIEKDLSDMSVIGIHLVSTDAGEVEEVVSKAYENPNEVCGGVPKANDASLDKCRTVLEDIQSRESIYLRTDRSNTGDVLNDGSTQYFCESGEDWVAQSVISGADQTWEDWAVLKDGKAYSRNIGTIHNPANGEGYDSGWVEGFLTGEVLRPWLLRFQWDDENITLLEHKTEGNTEMITIMVQGSPYESVDLAVSEYQVSFVLDGDGNLSKLLMHYTETWTMRSNDEETMGINQAGIQITLVEHSPEEVEQYIDQIYAQAIAGK